MDETALFDDTERPGKAAEYTCGPSSDVLCDDSVFVFVFFVLVDVDRLACADCFRV